MSLTLGYSSIVLICDATSINDSSSKSSLILLKAAITSRRLDFFGLILLFPFMVADRVVADVNLALIVDKSD